MACPNAGPCVRWGPLPGGIEDCSLQPADQALELSADAGKSWTMDSLPYHAKGLAERNGTLFMATDNFKDLVALVSSADGKSWKSRLRFDQISAIKPCVYASCRASCDLLAGLTIFPSQVCDTMAKPAPPPSKAGGCSCTAAPAGDVPGLWAAAAFALAVCRRRRPPEKTSGPRA